jgi:hypothetical protein
VYRPSKESFFFQKGKGVLDNNFDKAHLDESREEELASIPVHQDFDFVSNEEFLKRVASVHPLPREHECDLLRDLLDSEPEELEQIPEERS